MNVAWKIPGKKYFTIITKEFLSLFIKEQQGHSMAKPEDQVLSDEMILRHHKHIRTKYRHSGGYRNFTKLTRAEKIPLLRHPRKNLPVCNKNDREFRIELHRYQGIRYAQIPNVYPPDGSGLVIQICQSAKSSDECKGNPLFEKGKAYSIAQRFLDAIFPQ